MQREIVLGQNVMNDVEEEWVIIPFLEIDDTRVAESDCREKTIKSRAWDKILLGPFTRTGAVRLGIDRPLTLTNEFIYLLGGL